MSVPVICTIAAKNYLAQVRCLTESFLEHHPGGRVFALMVDKPDGYYDPDQETFTTVLVDEIGIPNLDLLAFRYTVLELSTAVKPFFLGYLFENYRHERICYFDPDIYFYRPVDEIWRALETHAIVLTPHLTGPLDDEFLPNELTILRAGTYNLGFIGLSRHPQTEELLRWWQGKMFKYCAVAFGEGLFVDQRWVDLVPGRFSSVHIHRDPGCNVAYWNLYHRHVTLEDGEYLVNGVPLKFYHFSGFSPDRPAVLSKHQTRYEFDDLPVVKTLFDGYVERLRANGYDTVKNWPYAYSGRHVAGVELPDVARALWRRVEVSDPAWEPPGVAAGKEFIPALLDWLNEPVDDSRVLPITRLAMEVYHRRPDVQRVFPDVLGRDRVGFARWFVEHGKEELNIDEFFVRPLAAPLAKLPAHGRVESIYRSFTAWLFRTGIGWRVERILGQRMVGRIRRLFTGSTAPPAASPPAASPAGSTRPARRGVNVIGYLRDETGVGESARATIRALHHHDFPLAWTMVKSYHARQNDDSVLHLPQGHPYDINLFYVNADQMEVVYNELGADFFAGKYNIGYWAWELDSFPEEWRGRFDYLDEVWVGSRFVQNTLAHVSPIPVVIMGVEMDRRPPGGVTRAALGLPDDRFIFLFAFDMLSIFERKNPLGAIEAYRRAFGPRFPETTLVIKVTKLDMFPEYRAPLEEALAAVSGVLIDGYLDRPELDSLFAACDAYISLHRSEGFGMTIAEAMHMGKPVIATDYAGNTDFMNVSNSYPVMYDLVELTEDYGPYKKGNVWADPDLDHAAYLMRRVFENRAEAAQKGARAARDIERWYGKEAMARKIIQRLDAISTFGK